MHESIDSLHTCTQFALPSMASINCKGHLVQRRSTAFVASCPIFPHPNCMLLKSPHVALKRVAPVYDTVNHTADQA